MVTSFRLSTETADCEFRLRSSLHIFTGMVRIEPCQGLFLFLEIFNFGLCLLLTSSTRPEHRPFALQSSQKYVNAASCTHDRTRAHHKPKWKLTMLQRTFRISSPQQNQRHDAVSALATIIRSTATLRVVKYRTEQSVPSEPVKHFKLDICHRTIRKQNRRARRNRRCSTRPAQKRKDSINKTHIWPAKCVSSYEKNPQK